jgi:bifunctional enzyme CysN/CysC
MTRELAEAASINRPDLGTLRFLTCGSVDDGKSTLIGRLLYDTNSLPADEILALESASPRYGTTGSRIDLSLALDGLIAEREQNITIDVAYRYCVTSRRRFIIADSPGHEQFTRNMVTAASRSSLGVLLVDAQRGLVPQTLRHLRLLSLMRVRHVVLAVNKIDAVSFDEATCCRVCREFGEVAGPLGFLTRVAIPLSGLHGDNVVTQSRRTPWYSGPALLPYLEGVAVAPPSGDGRIRFSVQLVLRQRNGRRGYAGTALAGVLNAGDEIVVARSGQHARIASIVTFDGPLRVAEVGSAVTLTLDRDVDISRGDTLSGVEDRPLWAATVSADIVWMDDAPLEVGRPYWLKAGAQIVGASVSAVAGVLDVKTGVLASTPTVQLNEVGRCSLVLATAIAFDSYDEVQATGSFILIDQLSNGTAAGGMIRSGPTANLGNLSGRALTVSGEARARLNNQRACVLWFTGLSGAGKSTVAYTVEQKLFLMSHRTYVLDGDNVRHGLSRGLGFTDEDRTENIRRVAEAAKLIADAGLIVLVALISPSRRDREMAREIVRPTEFVEVFVDAPLALAEARDPKGLYRKARRGLIRHVTGIDSVYEAPAEPELRLETARQGVEDLADAVIECLRKRGHLKAPSPTGETSST